MATNAERQRLLDDAGGQARWKRWGPYLSGRQWGTVREDYSAGGDAWLAFTHDQARSRAYRWGEDGLGGICDRWQHLCFALALWNERDPILKERLFGLDNHEGNHGEDVKELWWPLDSTPTHSYMRWLYRYPQAEFPYSLLVEENRSRGRQAPELELVDTGIFEGDRFFDVEVVYAKASPDDICIAVHCTNRGPTAAKLHVLPTLWFRNTWSWGRDDRYPNIEAGEGATLMATHSTAGRYWLAPDSPSELLFCHNDTNRERLWGVPSATPYPKDGIGDHVIHGRPTVNPDRYGTKAAIWYRLEIAPGATHTLRFRLADHPPDMTDPARLGPRVDAVIAARSAEADGFFAALAPPGAGPEARSVQRQAVANLLWGKQYYRYHVGQWLEGDPASPPPPPHRAFDRNAEWRHLANTDVISMPDDWEYPWYAAWDLAFHAVALAAVDPAFAKEQLVLLCREWYMHPNGQLPAYEWDFGDVNPPVHAWAAWRVFTIDRDATGRADYDFLERVFHKLMLNFTWWVNRKDAAGRNVFEGGFLGLDNIGPVDRSRASAAGAHLKQADATSWMAMFCLDMLTIALDLSERNPNYEDIATKFFEHFLSIAHALNNTGPDEIALWDDEDGFFYDVLQPARGEPVPLKVRSIVGATPLFAVSCLEPQVLARLPDFAARVGWFRRHRPELSGSIHPVDDGSLLLAVVDTTRLRRVLEKLFDPERFLSDHGIRSLSRWHLDHPLRVVVDGQLYEVAYEPGESVEGMFGGNSNWRGPVWWPVNYLLIESLRRFHEHLGDGFSVEFPTGSGHQATLGEVADELAGRLVSLFLPGPGGRRPLNADRPALDAGPLWRPLVTFPEFFHGDTGAGLGASHQGWTTLVAELIRQGS